MNEEELYLTSPFSHQKIQNNMRKYLLIILVALLSTTTVFSQTNAPAFPGAEGHGRYTSGGRGGKIVHVTNLNDSGTGSFRAAVSGSEKKIVVFDVGGIIALERDLDIGENTTILGQTAPNPGITLRYYTIRPASNNIIRFVRFRRGEERNVNDGADAIWQREKNNIILDHCSFSWSIDEIASFYDNRNFTMQWCTLGEALANPGHTKGEHSYGGIWGGKGASFHHNFLCHMQNRVPRFCGARYNWEGYDKSLYSSAIQAEIVDFRNCVMYNWGNGNGCYGGTGGGNINIVNNYYKAGPGTVNTKRVTQISVATSDNASESPFMGYCARYYINGNYVNAAGSEAENYDWKGVIYDSGTYTIDGERYVADADHKYGDNLNYTRNSNGTDCLPIKLTSPATTGEVTTHSAQKAYEKVLAYCGASMYRDGVDARYMDEAKNGTTTYIGSATITGDGKTVVHRKGIIDYVKDQGTYTLASSSHPAGYDTDNDGMPDVWENANGLNPNDASDARTYTLDSKGFYTNLEVFANALIEDLIKAENADATQNVQEHFPSVVKAEGIAYYNGTPADGTSGQGGDQPSTEAKTCTVKFNGSDVQSPDNYFTFGNSTDNKHNFNNKFTGTYNGTKYTKGLKMEGTTLIEFTNASTATVIIVQSTWSEHTIKFDGVEIELSSATTPEGSSNVRVYTIEGVAPGNHKIQRGSGESGVFYVEVRESGTSAIVKPYAIGSIVATEYYDLQGRRIDPSTRGVIIRVDRMSNGQKKVTKVIQ